MAALGLVLLAWRGWLVANGMGTAWWVLFKTHLRLDSIAFGVWLEVIWHFPPDRVAVVRRFRVLLLVAGLLLTLPAHFFHYEHPFAGPLTSVFTFVGFYSYSIYLWHFPIHHVLIWLGMPTASAWIYFAGSLVVGVLSAKAIEFPTLRLRDRWFPAGAKLDRSGAGPRPASVER